MIFLRLLCLFFLLPIFAFGEESLGKFGDWSLYRYSDSAGETCTLSSQPLKSSGAYTKRDAVYFHITARAESDWEYILSTTMGYPIKSGSEVIVQIDGRKEFNFYAQGEHSFLNSKQTEVLLDRLRAGSLMLVKGVSTRGTATTDRFSLRGVTKGLQMMQKKCIG